MSLKQSQLIHMEQSQSNKGIALIELLIAIAISSVIIGLAIQVMVLVRSSFLASNIKYVSRDLLDSSVDIIRSIKESSWDTLSLEGVYHPVMSGDQWTLASGDEAIAGTQFTRAVQIDNVCRDSNLLIVDCPDGTIDPDSKQIIVDISWTSPVSGSLSTTQLITRYAGNGFWNQTTSTDFNSGDRNNTSITTSDDGEIVLESNTGPGWGAAGRVGNINITNSQTVNSFAVDDGRLFIVKDNDPGGQEFLIYSLANPASPSLISATELGSNGKKIFVSGGYAFVATSDDNQEVKIYNITDPTAPLPTSNINLSGSVDATNLTVSGNRLYVIRALDGTEKEFNTVNIANPASPTLISSQDFSDTISDIYLDGRYIYLSTHIDNQEVVVVDLLIEYPTNNIAATYDISGIENATSIFFQYPNIYLSSAQNKIFILSAATPASISELSQFSINNIGDMYIADNKGFFVDNISGLGLYIYDLSDPATPSPIGTHSIGANSQAVLTVGSYAYALTQSNSRELIVVNGGGSNYVTYGELYSQTFNTNNGFTSVQSVNWDADVPNGTELKFQVAVNSLGYGFEFLGPDGTPTTYYTSNGAYPLTGSDGQYIRAKILLTGDGIVTPTVNNFRITYIQ